MRIYSHKFILEKQEHKTNQLINSSSPYLRQHAHNPVEWIEWSEEAFERAKSENKLVIVSIGYSACHWCHVMAHECFEDEDVAETMNKYFVCIKVDREELPDVDQTYMDACQLINGNGGWPLNAFTLPDKRPIHALTYMPKPQWKKLLITLNELWTNRPDDARDYASKLENGMKGMSLAPGLMPDTGEQLAEKMFSSFKERYDPVYGGMGRAPKFPMPNNLYFLSHYFQVTSDPQANKMLIHTLDSMALGGIYDPIAGGFARYSVDERWFAPHFEKMLYDNAQLIEIYAASHHTNNNEMHGRIARETIEFCEKELKNEYGLYASALDADSEGHEGYYYTFTYEELSDTLGQDLVFFSQYYQCRPSGNWEDGRNILYALDTIDKAARQFEMDPQIFEKKIISCLDKLRNLREKRTRPGLDYKAICSWNNLLLKAYSEAARFMNDPATLEKAIKLADAIWKHFEAEKDLKRINTFGKASVDAYLEDYATLIDGLISLYKVGFDESHLQKARDLCQKTIDMFFDSEKKFFRFNSGEALINHKYDTSDDVINSGNSIMARNLHNLSWYFDRPDWRKMALEMIRAMKPLAGENAPWYSNWASLCLRLEFGFDQLMVAGPEEKKHEWILSETMGKPDCIIGYTSGNSAIPLLEHKSHSNKRLLYHCKDQTCMQPIEIE